MILCYVEEQQMHRNKMEALKGEKTEIKNTRSQDQERFLF